MSKTKLNSGQKLGLAAAAVSALAIATPAEAANLAAGSVLNIGGSVHVPDEGTFEFFGIEGNGTTAETPEPVGEYGEFEVEAGNTGSFEGLEGDVGDILSFDTETDFSQKPLLRVEVDDTQQELFVNEGPSVNFIGEEDDIATVRFNGVFRNGDDIAAEGVFTSQFARGTTGETSYSASFSTVPEPTTMAGSAIALGFGAFVKRKRAKKQKDQEELT